MKKLYTLFLGAAVALSASATTAVLQKNVGANRADIEISKKTAELAPIKFENVQTEISSKANKISPKESWVSAGKVSYTDDIMASIFKNVENQTYEVDLEVDEDDASHYRLVNPYKNWENPFSDLDYDESKDYYMEFTVYEDFAIFESTDLGFLVPNDDDPSVKERIVMETQAKALLNANKNVTPQMLASIYPDVVATYQNGVITYPPTFVGEDQNGNPRAYTNILVGIGSTDEGYYAGNRNGKFQIVMPGATVDPNAGWEDWGQATWSETLLSNSFKDLPVQTLKVDMQKSTTVEGLYRIVDPYKTWVSPFDDLTLNANKTSYMVIHCEEAPHVWIEDFGTGMVISGEGEVKVTSQLGDLCKSYGAAAVAAEFPDGVGTLKDNVITYPSIVSVDGKQYLNFLLYTGDLTDDTEFFGGANNEFKLVLPTSGINDAVIDLDNNAPVEYFNLQGVRVANPAAGELVIKRQGETVTKTIVR